MEMNNKERYQFPTGHDRELRKFVRMILTGLLILVICGVVLIWYADRILVHTPFQWEKNFVRPYEELILKYWVKEERGVETERYLQSLADALTRTMQMTEEVVIRVHYVDSDTVNAFATLGGNIFVFRGLMEVLPDENSLAMVLAHEIAHIKHRDPIVSMGRGALLQVAYSLLSGSGGDIFRNGSEMGMMFFSREQETQADREAVAALYRRYGYVAGATTFFEVMLEQKGTDAEQLPEWFSSHPKLNQRVAAINKYILQQGWSRGEEGPKPQSSLPPKPLILPYFEFTTRDEKRPTTSTSRLIGVRRE
jgi:Zn-dependent protease with chaperone function